MDTTAQDMTETGKEMGHDTMENLKGKFEQGREAAKKYAGQAKEMASEYASKAGEYKQKAKDATEEQIKTKPFESMLVALGVGACLGMCVGLLFGSRDND